jgi:tetratricopeptide (TPR) repeat protein
MSYLILIGRRNKTIHMGIKAFEMKNWISCAALLALIFITSCQVGRNPHEKKGDNYFNMGRYEDAFAEYSVALRQKGENPDILRKIGKTGFFRNDLFETQKAYFPLLKLSPDDSSMVIIDFYRLGLNFYEKNDHVQMALAFESIFRVDSTYNIGEYFYYLADYYHDEADFDKAVMYYTKALIYRPEHEKVEETIFRLALSNEKIENYNDAFVYYEQFLRKFPESDQATTVEWHRGLCAFNIAGEELENGKTEAALDYVRIPLSTGQPQVKQDDAWYLKGEIFLELAQKDSALVAYEKVLELNPSRTGRLVTISQQRIREIKFGN